MYQRWLSHQGPNGEVAVHQGGLQALEALAAGSLDNSIDALGQMEQASDQTITLLSRLGQEIGQ